MGVLDNVFGGLSGVSSVLHNMLGGTATVKYRSLSSGALVVTSSVDVPFVPTTNKQERQPETSEKRVLSGVRTPANILSGTIPCAFLLSNLREEIDVIAVGGVDYVVTTVETLRVGNVNVQYAITARKC